MPLPILEPRVGADWRAEATRVIERLRKMGPYAGVKTRGCYPHDRLDLYHRTFHFTGKGRDTEVVVTLCREAFVHLLMALRDAPSIQVTGTTFGSYRSCVLQKELYDRYRAGTGYLAAPPGESWHNVGLSVDLYRPTKAERHAMSSHNWEDLLPADPPHYTLGRRG